jgi:hypothetical protein
MMCDRMQMYNIVKAYISEEEVTSIFKASKELALSRKEAAAFCFMLAGCWLLNAGSFLGSW